MRAPSFRYRAAKAVSRSCRRADLVPESPERSATQTCEPSIATQQVAEAPGVIVVIGFRKWLGPSLGYGEQFPGTRHAPERVLPLLREPDPRPDNEVLYGRGDKNLAGCCQHVDPGSNVNGQSTEIVTPPLTFAGMESCPDLYPELLRGLSDGCRAADATARPVERDEESVSGLFDLSASYPSKLSRTTRS